jgi:hypothetical protein
MILLELFTKTFNFSITSTKTAFYLSALTIDSLVALTLIVFDLKILEVSKRSNFLVISGGVTT